jgi:ribonuclease-3
VNFFLYQHIKLLFCSQAEKEFFFKIKHLLGFSPHSTFYYKKAFTHKSANCIVDGIKICNERLEYLGDSYPDKSEGFLTQIKSRIVNRKSLNKIAISLHLDAFIDCNICNVRKNDAMGNAFEALIGAIYLDKGYNATRYFVVHKILINFFDFTFLEKVDKNYKSKLLEIVQKNRDTFVKFNTECEDESEVSSEPKFTTTVFINEQQMAQGKGHTKKDSEQHAAQLTIKMLNKKTPSFS